MEVRDLVRAVWRRRWIVLLTTIVAAAVAYVQFKSTPPTYETSAQVRVFTSLTGDESWTAYALDYSDRLASTYVALLTSDAVRDQIQRVVDVDNPSTEESGPIPRISAEIVPNTEFLRISAQSTDPVLAAFVVNQAAQLLSSGQAPTLAPEAGAQTAGGARPTGARVEIVQTAAVPTEPSGLGLVTFVGLIGMAGLLGGILVALVVHAVDPTVRDSAAIVAASGLPLLAEIPYMRRRRRFGPLQLQTDSSREVFRRLRIHLSGGARSINVTDGGRISRGAVVLLVVDTQPGDGASTVAAHLADVSADSGASVLLIDANLRRPSLHRLLALNNSLGLSNLLAGTHNLEAVARPAAAEGFHVVLSGGARANPGQLLVRGLRDPKFLESARARYEFVIIDTPAFPSVADAAALAPFVDGILLVARWGVTHADTLATAVAEWNVISPKLIGIVANATPRAAMSVGPTRHYKMGSAAFGSNRKGLQATGESKVAPGRQTQTSRFWAED